MGETHDRTSQGAVGLAGEFITSPEIYSQETKQLFESSWICVDRTSRIDSTSCLNFEVAGHRLFACRGDDDEIRVFRNFCRHRGSRLITGDRCAAVGERIRCPYHAWTYDRNGRLISAPNMAEVKGFSKDDYELLQVECDTWHGFLWVRLEADPISNPKCESLDRFLEPLDAHARTWSLDHLKIERELVYDVEANWKLIFQNYSECYHCPSVHPALNRLTPFKGSSNDLESGPILGGPMKLADDCATMSTNGVPVGQPLPKLGARQRRTVAYYTLFPSIFLSFHPDYVLVHRLERVSFDETRVVCQFLFHPDSLRQSGFDPTPAVEFWDLTNRQDWHVCELAHQGIQEPGYLPGPYSNLESVVAAFDRHYLSQMSTSQNH